MQPPALEMLSVSKKFRKGELYDSLRDAIPGLARRLLRGRLKGELNEREFWAVRDVSLSVNRGEVLGIIGHNGAGKSTMLKLLSGVLRPTSGHLHVNGKLSALIEVGAGFHPDLTGRENIYLNGTILGMSRKDIRACFDRIVDFSGLEEFLDTPVKRYSTGMYARLGFAVAAHVNPDILIVDEVLSVGDYAFQNKCMERMREVVKSGAAVVFVSHNLSAVASLCTKVVLLDHGRVMREGCPQDVIRAYLSRVRAKDDVGEKDAYVSHFDIRDKDGPKVRFESGDDVFVDVEVKANRRCEKLSLSLYLRDDQGHHVFDTSTERLGHPSFTLDAGKSINCTFRLTLHLAPGSFHFGTHVYRYDVQRMYDDLFPAGQMFIDSEADVRGIANLYPTLTEFAPRDEGSLTTAGTSVPNASFGVRS